jgi:hypothetical protein
MAAFRHVIRRGPDINLTTLAGALRIGVSTSLPGEGT